MFGRRKTTQVPRLSEYFVRLGIPRETVEEIIHEAYDLRFAELGVARKAWTWVQAYEALRLQAVDRGDSASALRWEAERLKHEHREVASDHASLRARLALVGGKP